MELNKPEKIITGVDVMEEMIYEKIWKIRNFDVIYKKEALIVQEGFNINTGENSVSTCSFRIGLAPDHRKTEGFISPYCQLLKMKGVLGSSIDVKFDVKLLNKSGRPHYEESSDYYSSLKEGAQILLEPFFCHQKIIGEDRSATFFIKLTLSRHAISPKLNNLSKLDLEQRYHSNLHDNLIKLLSDEDSSDVKIFANDGVQLFGHKTILQMQNPVFALLLKSDCAESKTGVIRVDDISSKTMEIILRFIYTGDLLPTWKQPDIIVEFTYAAGKYQLTDILKVLDDSLGDDSSHKYSSYYVSLLRLTNKLSLKKAATRLMKQISQLAGKAKSVEEMLCILNTD